MISPCREGTSLEPADSRETGMTIDLRDAMEERALLVQASIGQRTKADAEAALEELRRLSDTAGARVVGSVTQRIRRPTPDHFIGKGKLAEVRLAAEHTRANLIIFDNELSPAQVNNLDLALGVKVIDRTELILQIFARRARSAESKIQVELAQLQYLVTRIPVSVKQHRFTGGIGMKGPGETPFQLRAAPMRQRIAESRRKLEEIGERRQRTRGHRHQQMVSLVGYTNAGKSTLLNALSAAGTYVDDRLFATLDTKTSTVYLPDARKVLLTDTVGFIRDLPHSLVASFRSTLDEVNESSLMLIVVDVSHPSVADHFRVVIETLEDIGAVTVPAIVVLNKSDCPARYPIPPEMLAPCPDRVEISALREQGLDELKALIAARLPPPPVRRPAPNWRDWPASEQS